MLQFVREIPLRIVMEGALSQRRGFLFYLAAGFHHEVDTLSGMSVNLMDVDEWLWGLKNDLEGSLLQTPSESLNHAYAELMAIARLRLSERAAEQGALLTSLVFREERGWSFSWESSLSPETLIFSHGQWVELISGADKFDLARVEFAWSRVQGCEEDFAHESLRVMKSLADKTVAEVLGHLRGQIVLRLPSGSYLKNISITYLGEDYKITI